MAERLELWGDVGVRATVPALLAAAAAKYGARDFIVTRDERMTFAEVEERSRALAKRFLAAGAGKGTRIGILLPTGPEFAVAFLAAARIGALSTLLSTTYRPGEIRRALKLADVELLLAPQQIFGRDYEADLEEAIGGLAEAPGEPFYLPAMPYLRRVWLTGSSERAWPGVLQSETPVPAGVDDALLAAVEAEVYPADELLVIWTSGSSSDPKGVVHTHGVAVRKVSPQVGLGLHPSDPAQPRTFVAQPFFWVPGPQNLLGCLHTGNMLVTQPRVDLDEMLELVERERCTFVLGYGINVEELRNHPEHAKRDLSSLTNTPNSRVLPPSSKGDPPNWGMSETFGPHFDSRLFDYRVIDRETGATLPDGEEGEFIIRGLGVMRGLYKKEREETFDADGYYHTGDRGYLENGNIYFTGRYSEMIKSGGANISPLEVEQAMESLCGVRRAFVFGVPHPTKHAEAVAIVVPDDGCVLDADQLASELKKELSGYKVPRRIRFVGSEDVPLLATGKADKRSMIAAFQQSEG